MSINKLKSIVRRGTMFGAVFAIVAATFAPASLTFADALNPLTNRSLTLSSSAPGWDSTDGSGNATYAPPNSGANGQKTGNTFAFNVSTDSTGAPIKAFTFQYCTASAGNCTAPGNNLITGGTTRAANGSDPTRADLSVVTGSGGTAPSELDSGVFTSLFGSTLADVNGEPGIASPVGNEGPSTPATITGAPNRDDTEGNFIVMTKHGTANWQPSYGWDMTAANDENGTIAAGTKTGQPNKITITKTAGIEPQSTDSIKIVFFATDNNYITNPGAGAFFVKINDYTSETVFDDTTLVDGGVTVANVMNLSIEIQTKVLETMDFSVGTIDPYTLSSTDTDSGTTGVQSPLKSTSLGQDTHGQCDAILTSLNPTDPVKNVLQLGDQTQENSLSTARTYSTHSYWRLSSNSSAGATVYYSGVTLKNTVGDQINAIGTTPSAPLRGTPQFGLAIANDRTGNLAVNYSSENQAKDEITDPDHVKGIFENGADTALAGIDASVATDTASLTGYHAPQLAPLAPTAAYGKGAGVVNNQYGTVNTEFAFDPNSNIVPTPLAEESQQVVDCVTAKVRYIANIAATTPAGIYTTKVNYIAAPQY